MTSLLRKRIKEIKEQCQKEFGVTIVVEQTKDDSSWTLSNFTAGKSVIIGEVGKEEDLNHSIHAFKINVSRWNWAIEEGFTRDEIVSKLSHEVFQEIQIKKIVGYLK